MRGLAARASAAAAAAGLAAAALTLPDASARAQPDSVAAGKSLFVEACASCHGADGAGTESGPDLRDAGAAGADFYLRTGRMPLASANDQAVRKEPAFSDEEIEQIVAYVATLGTGPEVPELSLEAASLQDGMTLFVANCAPCHGAAANGGAAGRDAIAPGLQRATPLEIAEAIEVGPGQMPVFGFSDEDRDAVVAYVQHLDEADDPGGADIGGIGPVPEGFVAWGVGMLSLVAAALVIGNRRGSES
ncbi:MAG TPA: c-type cytochrome [Actinomycetota bacterium]|nr:c-type cytochrome [Actinomycetota bacterium]